MEVEPAQMTSMSILTGEQGEIEVIVGERGYGEYKIEGIRGDFPRGVNVEWNNRTLGGEVDSMEISIYGTEGRGRMEVMQRGDRLHLWHLYVPPRHRGKGIGSVMIGIFKQLIDKTAVADISGRIGNGHSKDFLVEHGFPIDEMETVTIEEQRSEPSESVAIGGGAFAIDAGPDQALDEYPGFPVSEIEW